MNLNILDSKSIQFHETDDLDSFNHLNGNREINKSHVKKIAKSINSDGYNWNTPIIVNSELKVIDGQHRLEACKQLNHPVWFCVINESTIHDALRLNALAKNWSMDDYIHLFSELGYEDYILFFNTKKSLEIKSAFLFHVLNGAGRDKVHAPVKTGEFKFSQSDADLVIEIFELISRLKPIVKHLDSVQLFEREHVKAIVAVALNGDFNWEHFFNQLRQQSMSYTPQRKKEDYLKMIEGIYNYRQKKTRIELV